MNERELSPEAQIPRREQVVAALRAIVERGYTNPDDLPDDDPEIQVANAAFYAWQEEAARRAAQSPDPAAALDHQHSASMVYVDAGFTDPDYLDEVANDWLVQDLDTAHELGLSAVVDRIRADIDAINARLAD